MKIGVSEVFLIVFAAATFLQLFYFLFFYSRITFHKKTKAPNLSTPPVSVVICARSESSKLVENLPYILDQNYADYEVVIVNDRSWDDTKEILKAFQVRYPRLKVINIEESNHEHYGKKMALTIGIKGAKHELLLLTDADCRPLSGNWITEMVSAMNENRELVLGYSPYEKKPGFLNRVIRFDTQLAGLQYLSFAKAGTPYMGVGRNLMYRKELFFRVSGFKRHYHLSSGDDDLFVNQTARKKNAAVMITPASHCISSPKTTFVDWFRQKKRHFTTAPHYRFVHKLLLSLWPLSLLTMIISTIGLIVLNSWLLIILGCWIFRLMLQMITFSRSSKWLGDKDLVIWSPVLEIVLLFIHPAVHISNRFVKAEKWN